MHCMDIVGLNVDFLASQLIERYKKENDELSLLEIFSRFQNKYKEDWNTYIEKTDYVVFKKKFTKNIKEVELSLAPHLLNYLREKK